MFGTIIDINSSNKISIGGKKFVKLVPEFYEVYKDKNLGGTMILYIVLVYDNRSPYRHLPLDVRKEDLSEVLFGKKNYHRCNHEKVQKAIKLYKYLQYDPLKEEYQAIVNKHNQKLKVYNAMEVNEDNFNTFNKSEKLMQQSQENLKKLKEQINAEEEEKKIMGQDGTSLSYIEERINQYRNEQSLE